SGVMEESCVRGARVTGLPGGSAVGSVRAVLTRGVAGGVVSVVVVGVRGVLVGVLRLVRVVRLGLGGLEGGVGRRAGVLGASRRVSGTAVVVTGLAVVVTGLALSLGRHLRDQGALLGS